MKWRTLVVIKVNGDGILGVIDNHVKLSTLQVEVYRHFVEMLR